MKVIYMAIFYILLFVSVEYITRKKKLNKELSRKFIHVVAGVTLAFLPFYMSFDQIAILGALFIPVMAISKKQNIFSSIHHVKRQTYGEIYFPVAIVLTALLFPHRDLFIYALLIMAISDGFASIIGQRYGKMTYSLIGSSKSYVGSAVFLIAGLIISFIVLRSFTNIDLTGSLVISLLSSSILTVIEGSLSYGLDNLVLSPLAALLLQLSIKIIK